MTKQEEIKIKAYRLFCQHCQALQKTMGWEGKPCWVTQYNEPEAICASAIDAVDGLFTYLHSQGVVVKVVRELPNYDSYYKTTHTPRYDFARRSCWSKGQFRMLSVGYVAVEPLMQKDMKEVPKEK